MRITMLVLNSVWHDPRVRRAAETAKNSGLDVTVIGVMESAYNKDRIAELPFTTIITDSDLSLHRGDISIFKKIKREYKTYSDTIKACIKSDPDVIHANDLNALPIAYLAAKKTKSGIVYDSHEIFCENTSIKKSRFKHFFWNVVERFLIKRVGRVVCVSNASAEELAKIYKIRRPDVITNAARIVDPEKLLPKTNDAFEVLLHGKFYEGRGYEAFVKTAPLLEDQKDIKLIIRGLGPLEEELHRIANEVNAGDNLVFEPPVLVTEITKHAARSHVGVVITEPINLNFINTVSNKIFEYVMAGLPVLMSDVPEHRFLNDKYDFGVILEENTAECLAENIKKIHNDTCLYDRLAVNVKKMSAELNWENEFSKMIDIYNELRRKEKGISK